MGPIEVVAGSTDQSVTIRIMDSTDGTPETGVEHNTAGIDLWYRREGAAKVSITEAALAALTTAHTDGGIEHIGDGEYRLDLPDAAFAVGAAGVKVGGTVTGMVVYAPYVRLLDPAANLYKSEALGGTGNDSTHIHVPTWTFGNDEVNDELVHILDVDQNEWHPAYITDWVNSTKLATVISARGGAALPFTPTSGDRVARLGFTRANLINSAMVTAIQSGLGTAANQTTLLGRLLGTIAAGTHVAQTGDSYDRIGATGSGLTSLAPATATTTLLARIVGTIATGTHNPQSGDAYARLGNPAGASVSADVASLIAAVITNAAGADVAADIIAMKTVVDALQAILDLIDGSIIDGAAATGTLSTTQATTNLTGYADDQLIGRILVVTSGAAEGEATAITDYAETGGLLTFDALTTAMGNADTFRIL